MSLELGSDSSLLDSIDALLTQAQLQSVIQTELKPQMNRLAAVAEHLPRGNMANYADDGTGIDFVTNYPASSAAIVGGGNMDDIASFDDDGVILRPRNTVICYVEKIVVNVFAGEGQGLTTFKDTDDATTEIELLHGGTNFCKVTLDNMLGLGRIATTPYISPIPWDKSGGTNFYLHTFTITSEAPARVDGSVDENTTSTDSVSGKQEAAIPYFQVRTSTGKQIDRTNTGADTIRNMWVSFNGWCVSVTDA